MAGRHNAIRCRSCVPSAVSPEAGLIYLQGVLLVSRTLLTDCEAMCTMLQLTHAQAALTLSC